MKKSLVVLLLLVLASLVAVAGDNTEANHVSKYVMIHHSTINHGKGMVFDNLVRQVKAAANSSNSNFYWLAMHNITGPENQVTFLTFHDTLADLDASTKSFDNIIRAAMKTADLDSESAQSEGPSAPTVLAKYREDLSYTPSNIDAAHATRYSVLSVQLRPGFVSDYENMVKEMIDLERKNNLTGDHIVYEVMAGAPTPTFIIVHPMKSLADLDDDAREKAYKAAFTPELQQKWNVFRKEGEVAIHEELVGASPELSRPPQTFLAANPDFWNVKEEPMVASTPRTTKQGPVRPAASKTEKH